METIIIIASAIMFAAGVYAGRHWEELTKDE